MNYFTNFNKDFSLQLINNRMLLKSNIIDFNRHETYDIFKKNSDNQILKDNNNVNKSFKNRDINIFYPNEKDTLFWCYYINRYGINEYLQNKKKSFTIEHNFKITIIEKIRNMKDVLKQYKLKKLEIEDELLNKNKIGLSTFILFMLLDNTNALIVKKNSYQKIIFNHDDKEINLTNFFVIFNDGDKYYIDKLLKDKDIKKIVDERYQVNNFIKPLNAISSYRLKDLQDIAKILKIDLTNSNKNKIKQDLYKEILEKIV